MAVTNLLAFTSYFPDATLGGVVLESKGIDPTLSDANEIAMAWGMLEKVKSSDYSQGKTSEKLSPAARKQLVEDAKAIFKAKGIVYIEHHTAHIIGLPW